MSKLQLMIGSVKMSDLLENASNLNCVLSTVSQSSNSSYKFNIILIHTTITQISSSVKVLLLFPLLPLANVEIITKLDEVFEFFKFCETTHP